MLFLILQYFYFLFIQDGTGKISVQNLRQVCFQFNLPTEPELLEQVMDYCDTDRDGLISYLEFSNFLNWKDKLPSGFQSQSATGEQEQGSGQGEYRLSLWSCEVTALLVKLKYFLLSIVVQFSILFIFFLKHRNLI